MVIGNAAGIAAISIASSAEHPAPVSPTSGWDPYEVWRARVLLPRLQAQALARSLTALGAAQPARRPPLLVTGPQPAASSAAPLANSQCERDRTALVLLVQELEQRKRSLEAELARIEAIARQLAIHRIETPSN